MAIVQPRDEEPSSPSQAPYAPFPTTPLVEDSNLLTFITDFFNWLETAWQLPLFAPETPRNPLPHPLDLTDSLYTARDLVRLYGYSASRTHNLLDAYGIAPQSYAHPGGRAGRHALFTKQDLAPVIGQWEWERLLSAIDDWWQRFFPLPAGHASTAGRTLPIRRPLSSFFVPKVSGAIRFARCLPISSESFIDSGVSPPGGRSIEQTPGEASDAQPGESCSSIS